MPTVNSSFNGNFGLVNIYCIDAPYFPMRWLHLPHRASEIKCFFCCVWSFVAVTLSRIDVCLLRTLFLRPNTFPHFSLNDLLEIVRSNA